MKLLRFLAVMAITFASVTAAVQDKAYFGVRAAYDMNKSTKSSYMTGWGQASRLAESISLHSAK